MNQVRRLTPVPASREILEKIEDKHGIQFHEIEELFLRPHVVLRGPIDQYGERRYTSLGKTSSGRHLLVVYTVLKSRIAKVITGREMTDRERRYYRGITARRGPR
jgi:uncharacterized DUF497 family protein